MRVTLARPSRRQLTLLLLPALLVATAGVALALPAATARAWFDQPLPGSRLSLGQVDVTAHATAPGGVEEVTLTVDGAQVDSVVTATAPLVTAQFSWLPTEEKGYVLTVQGRSGSDWGTPATIFVVVGAAAPTEPTPGTGSACDPDVGASANVLLSTDFESGPGPFKEYDFDVVAGLVRDGAFHLTFTGSGDISTTEASQQFDNVCVEADVVDVGPNASGRYGVFCRLPEEGTYYEFFIDSSGRAGTRVGSFLTAGSQHQPVYYDTSAVNTGLGAVNRIRGDCVGSSFTMWVNGQFVGSFQDSSASTGDVGILATSATDGGTDVAFDNFIVLEAR